MILVHSSINVYFFIHQQIMKIMRTRHANIFLLFFLIFFCQNVFSQFIENKGQVLDLEENFRPEVLFYAGWNGDAMYFEKNRIVCVFSKPDEFDFSIYEGNQKAIDSIYQTLGRLTQRIDIEFLGSNSHPKISSGRALNYYTNFYLNKRENIQDVKSFNSITYENVWDHIDIIFYQSDGGIKYDIILHEGANINDIQIRYNGASEIILDNNQLRIKTLYRSLAEDIPLAYINGNENEIVEVDYVVHDDVISFKTTSSDYKSLTIDPILIWATYFETATSGGNLDYDHNVADVDGNLFIYGVAWNAANNYPVVNPGGGAYIMNHVSNNGYLAKFNANRTLVWATYFGGSTDIDWSLGAEVMYISGTTLHIVGDQLSSNAPKPNGGGYYYSIASSRPFWIRFNKDTGAMLHCTNIGGHTSSYPSISVSPSGQVAIILSTYDWGIPAGNVVNRAGAFNQALNGGFQDMFLYLFNSSFGQIWGTWLGGPGTQESAHVTFDSNNNIFFVIESQWFGASTIANERLVNPGGGAYYQSTNFGIDLMIGKFTSAGVLFWNTLYGGSSRDGTRGNFGNSSRVYTHPTTNELLVTAGTMSTNLPLQVMAGAYNKGCPSYITGSGGMCSEIGSFILKFSNNGVRQWATYWGTGPNGCDLLYNAKFVDCDKFIVAARANETTLPFFGYYNQASGGQAFLMQFNSNYMDEWSSYVGLNTGVPKIAYSPYQTRLYLSTVTSSQLETTLNPGGGAFFDGSFIGPHWGAYYITEFSISMPPPPITGPINICEGEQGVVYSVTPVTGATYAWTVPAGATIASGQGTNSITVNFGSNGGQVCVTITAPCVQNTPVCITVNMPTPGGTGLWTWTGGYSTNWFYGCNWDKNTVPTFQADVLIPGATPFQPTITGAMGHCNTITIATTNGAILTIQQTAGGSLQVHQ